eukprot:CAMPEP_0118953340 /NCGR_PEP_ID=MMETSP1169-20130426/56390_1 /TAXON_ID=36882 /ORGANISM="Pyramimonas obovata, Strain CCMP722" /LENGTH=59 /DNA_ID=CAMNT_0006900773 /DNA_START=205 /DNA_END=381 /DNA_ORIENTATION=+
MCTNHGAEDVKPNVSSTNPEDVMGVLPDSDVKPVVASDPTTSNSETSSRRSQAKKPESE